MAHRRIGWRAGAGPRQWPSPLVLGLVSMHGLTALVQDLLKHPPDVLIDALLASLTRPR